MSNAALRDMLKNRQVVVEDVSNNQNYQLVSTNDNSSESYTMNDFKNMVTQWVQLDKELTQKKDQIKALTQEKKTAIQNDGNNVYKNIRVYELE